ncbi:MAG: hypothetical protein C4K60_07300 [Ideonella sp. MAG2]|nr:MAG: hypothetical protein C4K60_07300 [Ideonella sp. MAG2]
MQETQSDNQRMSELSSATDASRSPWWLRPFWLACALVAFVLVGALIFPVWRSAPPSTVAVSAASAPQGLPWQIKADSESSEVFGLLVGQSGVAEAQARFGDNLHLALIQTIGAPASDAPALEGFVERLEAGFVTGRLVLAFEAGDELRRTAAQRSPKHEVGAGGRVRQLSLAADDADLRNTESLASQARLVGLSFSPSARLDEAALVARFGEPAERVLGPQGEVQLLYPATGVAIAVPGDTSAARRVVIQYVAPGEFEARLRSPLAAASATP